MKHQRISTAHIILGANVFEEAQELLRFLNDISRQRLYLSTKFLDSVRNGRKSWSFNLITCSNVTDTYVLWRDARETMLNMVKFIHVSFHHWCLRHASCPSDVAWHFHMSIVATRKLFSCTKKIISDVTVQLFSRKHDTFSSNSGGRWYRKLKFQSGVLKDFGRRWKSGKTKERRSCHGGV